MVPDSAFYITARKIKNKKLNIVRTNNMIVFFKYKYRHSIRNKNRCGFGLKRKNKLQM